MKKYKITIKYLSVILVALLGFTACEINPIDDPNNPSAESISANASLSEIQNVVDGSESGMREQLNQYFDGVGVIGREWYRFSGSDPRFTSDLLGKDNAVLDANTFYTTQPFSARYRAIKNLNILIAAITNTTAITDPNQKKAGIAYANTLKAYELLLVLNQQYTNGVRVNVNNPDSLGPFLSLEDSYSAIISLLDAAYVDLTNNSVAFPFTSTLNPRLPADKVESPSPAEFALINRAISARVHVYKGDWTNALTALNQSFFSLSGNFQYGVYHLFSDAGGDLLNPVFVLPNTASETRVAQPSYISDAEIGDSRLNKVGLRIDTAFQDNLSSSYDVTVYKTNIDAVPLVRNEELILIYAEISANTGNTADAVSAIDIIRGAAGLPFYTGPTTTIDLINEILKQRRYSLYGEGHRWVDMRRYNKLGELPIDRPGDNVWVLFPRPDTEN